MPAQIETGHVDHYGIVVEPSRSPARWLVSVWLINGPRGWRPQLITRFDHHGTAAGALAAWSIVTGVEAARLQLCCTCGNRPASVEYRGTLPDSDGWDLACCAGCIDSRQAPHGYDSRPIEF